MQLMAISISIFHHQKEMIQETTRRYSEDSGKFKIKSVKNKGNIPRIFNYYLLFYSFLKTGLFNSVETTEIIMTTKVLHLFYFIFIYLFNLVV